MKIKKLAAVLFAALLVLSFGAPVYADPPDLANLGNFVDIDPSDFAGSNDSGIEIDFAEHVAGMGTVVLPRTRNVITSVADGYTTTGGSISTTNTEDFYWLLDVNESPINSGNEVFGWRLSSSNPALVAALCELQNGSLGLTGDIAYADDEGVVTGLEANKIYVLYVTSLDGSAGSYSLSTNAGSPLGSLWYYSDDISDIKTMYNGSLYKNGVSFNIIASAQNSGWYRNDEYPVAYGFEQYTQQLANIKVHPNNYFRVSAVNTSTYSLPKGAVIFQLEAVYTAQTQNWNNGSSFMYFHSWYENINGNVQHPMNWRDIVTNRITPRFFDATDVWSIGGDMYDVYSYSETPSGQRGCVGYVVYDLASESIVDFYSPYNVFYATGAESFNYTP
ncbi:MAG: hypothetical protein LBQ16_00110 [Gracilibacteraceae bacterium]|jgi:hypothetical protein|nr:hypothetical protein [Gracilibacteraceae bacterium]